MRNYQYILLDWDGNLAKTLDLWLEAFRTVLYEEGFRPSDEEIAGSFGKTQDYFASLGITDPAAVYDRADRLASKKLPDVELYPDALEVLQYVKDKNKKTALITASPHANVHHLLERYKLYPLFDVVITRDDVVHHKPDPESLIKALEQLGGNKDQAIMIGDSDKDLGAAANAGVDSLLFYPPAHKKFYNLEKLKQLNPTYIVEDFRKVMDIVR